MRLISSSDDILGRIPFRPHGSPPQAIRSHHALWHVRVLVVAALAGGTTLAYAFRPASARTYRAPALGGRTAELTCATASCHLTTPANSGSAWSKSSTCRTYDLPLLPVASACHACAADSVLNPRWGFEITAVPPDSGLGVPATSSFGPGAAPNYRESLRFTTTSANHPTRQYVRTRSSRPARESTSRSGRSSGRRLPSPRAGSTSSRPASHQHSSSPTATSYNHLRQSDVGNTGVPIGTHGRHRLGAPHPNRRAPRRAELAITRPGFVDLAIFDLHGRRVRNGYTITRGMGRARPLGRRFRMDSRARRRLLRAAQHGRPDPTRENPDPH